MATIEIDGQTLEVDNGKMIIEAADDAGIYIPRFCYHKKLSVAANCRMCLVSVENNRKTVPACATPISNGMKVFTKSKEALQSQQIVMEFLLINHPLDCPICDQGGECELQDVSMGFGRDHSVYEESKRAVTDDNLGSLIATEMTRCIQCTRCVRFGDEIAGVRELGGLGRGEHMQIGTYVQHSMQSEVSGNIIDLCPVGALTAKPSRYTARAWELMQQESLAPHDCLGSTVYVHTRRQDLIRVVPKPCEPINELWLSDRDRFSYLGLNHPQRALEPMIKRHGQWETVDWTTALEFAAQGVSRLLKQHGPEAFAAFASASSSVEELYLLQKMMRDVGVNNLDHRLHQSDFRDQDMRPLMPENTLAYANIEQQHSVFLLGTQIHREVPLAGVRVTKAYKNGAKINALNALDYAFPFDVTEKIIVSPHEWPLKLASVLLALTEDLTAQPQAIQKLLIGLTVDDTTRAIALTLCQENAVIITGALYENHPEASLLRTLVAHIAQASGASHVHLSTGANAAGAWLAGMVPHRGVAGRALESKGLDVQAAIEARLKGYFLLATEPEFDMENPFGARQSMLAADFVVVLSAYQDESIQSYADVILPLAPYAQTSGTYINIDGTWQTVQGVTRPSGQARPAWKILRVLANLLHCEGFDYTSSEDVLAEVKQHVAQMSPQDPGLYYPDSLPLIPSDLVRVGEWPLYRCDAIVRHAEALQACSSADRACIRIHPQTAARYALGEKATVSQGHIEVTLPVLQDERVAQDVVWVPHALPETVDLGYAFSKITIQ